MARTREEVYSLFGIKSPAQVQAERDQAYAQQLQGLSGAGQAGAGIGRLFGSALGLQTAEEKQSAQMAEALQGVDPTNPAQLRELAKTVSSFAPEAALRMLSEAKTLETPETRNVYQQVQVPVLNAITGQPTGQFETKSIMRTAVYKGGQFQGYQDEMTTQGTPTIPGITDTPEAQAAREQVKTEDGVDLGGGVRLKLDGKTAVTDDQLEAARAGTPSGTVAQSVVADDGGDILPADKFPVEQGTADIQRGITTVAESDLAVPVSRRPDFETTPIQKRDDAIARLQQEDTSKLLGMLKALENQPTLTTEDQELLRMLTATLAERRKAPQQQQR